MACKFCAAMQPHRFIVLLLCAAALTPAQAEKADRSKPLTIEADQPGSVDLLKQLVIFNGNVVVAQGTLAIRAERVEVRERPDGHRSATALGSAAKPAAFKQKRDGVDEMPMRLGQRSLLAGRQVPHHEARRCGLEARGAGDEKRAVDGHGEMPNE